MKPNSNCWKKEETQSLADCVQCSDYEKVNKNTGMSKIYNQVIFQGCESPWN